MREAIKQLPGATRLYTEIQKRITSPDWYFGYQRWASARRIAQLKNKHRGERCFIIGNGPSLNKLDLTKLKNEYTIGMNRIYLMFPKLGFHTTYFACVNPLVVEQFGTDIEKLPMPKFIGWHGRKWMQFTSDTILLAPTTRQPLFSEAPTHVLWEGATVTYAAMQVAYYLGFQEVVLIGVDHNFVDQGKPHQEVVTQTHDANHFDPNYFGKGYRWNLPDLETSEYAYRLAKDHYERSGRRIIDATAGGKLQVFPKVDYDTLF
ncbi:MAG TPA: 6-hydroxymethylpterin diphosphokinase MptE-like protein [Phototrophicaceae bacterium]|jgi:hypothetical protein|nr:6-hydroxymethylpterin diphosphokinase MptE-like protein [Phototrophicaceae bacterium]